MFISVEGILYNAEKIIRIDVNNTYMHIYLDEVKKGISIKSNEEKSKDIISKWSAALMSKVTKVHDSLNNQTSYINHNYMLKANQAKDKSGVNRIYILTSDGENTGYAVDEKEANRILYDLERS